MHKSISEKRKSDGGQRNDGGGGVRLNYSIAKLEMSYKYLSNKKNDEEIAYSFLFKFLMCPEIAAPTDGIRLIWNMTRIPRHVVEQWQVQQLHLMFRRKARRLAHIRFLFIENNEIRI